MAKVKTKGTHKPLATTPGTLQHACATIGVSVPTGYKLIAQGKLRAFKVGRATRVSA